MMFRVAKATTANIGSSPLLFRLAGVSCVGAIVGYNISRNYSNEFCSERVDDIVSLIFPTMEALWRAGRLVKTASIMAADYHVHFITRKHPDSFLSRMYQGEDEQQQKAERLIYQLQEELERAQHDYVSESNSDTSQNDSAEQNERALKNKRPHMLSIANQLADAEDALEKSGSSSSVHERNATRLLDLFRANAGVYIKVGQHLANLDLLLPQDYVSRLSCLFDDAPVSSYPDGK
jgi:hypothetical protein